MNPKWGVLWEIKNMELYTTGISEGDTNVGYQGGKALVRLDRGNIKKSWYKLL